MKENKKKVCFRLNPKLIEELRMITEDLGKTKVWIVEDALDQYFKQYRTLNIISTV